MSLIDVVRSKLLFWRKPTIPTELSVDGCFTLPGATADAPSEACAPEGAAVTDAGIETNG